MEDLDELDAIFEEIGGNEKAEDVASGFSNPDDGVYSAEIKSAEYKFSKKGLPMVQISYGLENGQPHNQFLMLSGNEEAQTRRNIATFVTTMRKLGLDADKVSGYVAQLNKLAGKQVTLELITKKDYQRTSIIDVK